MDMDFNFASEEEMEEALDNLIEGVRDEMEEDECKTTILDPQKLAQMKLVYSVMKYLTKGTGAKVSYKLYEPFKTMGSVSVEAHTLEFFSPMWFLRTAGLASNTEVYPLAKDKVRLTFTFHGLTVSIEEEVTMDYPGCGEAAFDLIDEATKKFGPLYSLNREKYEKLDEICDLVDEVVWAFNEEFGCDAVTVDVDPTTKDLIFNIACDSIVLQHEAADRFFALLQQTDFVRFSKAGEDSLRVEVGVTGLWRMGAAHE